MTEPRPKIACLGAGRMGRGIAVAFAYAGHAVTMIDVKARSAEQFAALEAEAMSEVRKTLASLARFGLLSESDADAVIARVSVVPTQKMADALAGTGMVFEGVPEVVELKREVLAAASKCVGPGVIIASTTSTILVDDISGSVERPERFLNVHWLNPAYLIPLVEISPGVATDPAVIARVKALLEGIGKVPVVCAGTPGFIVPRIQALAMNEAARMVEEGVASAEEIDKAIRYGFGFRYAVLGLLEFIDWGGGDILYYASRYLDGRARQRPLSRARGHLAQHARGPYRLAHRRRLSRLFGSRRRRLSRAAPLGAGRAAQAFRSGKAAGTSAKHVLQHTVMHHRDTVQFDRRSHHRQVKMPGGVAAGELVGAGGKQEIAGDGAQLGAVGIALVVHRKRLVAGAGVHAEPDMGHRIGFAVAPCRKIGAHHGGVGAVALQIRDVIVFSVILTGEVR